MSCPSARIFGACSIAACRACGESLPNPMIASPTEPAAWSSREKSPEGVTAWRPSMNAASGFLPPSMAPSVADTCFSESIVLWDASTTPPSTPPSCP
jgi:hypothetical protein